jgi:hypothetical protein
MLPESGVMKTLLEWAWIGVAALIGIVWRKHNEEISDIKDGIKGVRKDMNENAKFLDGRIDAVERASVPMLTYEQNRKEVRDVQIKTFERLDEVVRALSRIEGKLDK